MPCRNIVVPSAITPRSRILARCAAVLIILLLIAAFAVFWQRDALRRWEVRQWPDARLEAESAAHPDDAILRITRAARLLASGRSSEALAAAASARHARD